MNPVANRFSHGSPASWVLLYWLLGGARIRLTEGAGLTSPLPVSWRVLWLRKY